jgi:DNA-binding HxlR family transcriptional regulator
VENQASYSKTTCDSGKNSCPVRQAFTALGGKWAFSIVYALLDGKKRFKELERSIDGINTRMLVKELKSMEENKIVQRTAYPTVPPTVEYALTEKGKKIKPILNELRKWGLEHA